MSDTILDSVALAYQPVWGRSRRLLAVRLGVLTVNPDAVDGAHLLQVLLEDWPSAAPPISISFDSGALRLEALQSEPIPNAWIEAPAALFTQPDQLEPLALAMRRGHRLIRTATLAQARSEWIAPLDVHSLIRPTAEEALEALRACASSADQTARRPSPFLGGQIYQCIGSRALADHCLDGQGALGLAGWPEDDVLFGWRGQTLLGARSVIEECQRGIEADCSIDHLERFLRQDPVLVYRLLMLVNSPALANGREIENLRHAIMMLGFSALKRWLADQLPGSDTDPNLHPIRYAQVMRARLAQHLLESGSEEELRAEVYLTALLAQLDRLMQKPLGPLLHQLPLSERVLDAVARQEGAYFSLLQVAGAQSDFERIHLLPAVCHQHSISLEHANRSLLRMLATSRDKAQAPREHPWSQTGP